MQNAPNRVPECVRIAKETMRALLDENDNEYLVFQVEPGKNAGSAYIRTDCIYGLIRMIRVHMEKDFRKAYFRTGYNLYIPGPFLQVFQIETDREGLVRIRLLEDHHESPLIIHRSNLPDFLYFLESLQKQLGV